MAEQAAEEIGILEDGKGRVKVLAQPLGHVSHAWAYQPAMFCFSHVAAQHLDVSALNRVGSGNEREQAGLADSVRADHADHFSGRYIQVDRIQRLRPAVAQAYIGKTHHRRGTCAAALFILHGGIRPVFIHCGTFTCRWAGHGVCGSSRT